MLNQCFNPKCAIPLHYLRDGRVFVFGVQDSGEAEDGEGSRLHHYWLCGVCAQQYVLAQSEGGVHMVNRKALPRTVEFPGPQAKAS